MIEQRNFFINGQWVPPHQPHDFVLTDPSTEEAAAVISLGGHGDVDDAIAAAKHSFRSWSKTVPEQRLRYVEKIALIYKKNIDRLAAAISLEMGAPIDLAKNAQADAGAQHIDTFIEVFKEFKFVRPLINETTDGRLAFDPIGVVGLITPWNWPMNQVTLKVIPALLAGCTMILKPSELAPLSSMIFAEILAEADLPAGVFNLVNGDGAGVGTYLSGHEDIEMISFTGSTRAGKLISKNAADTLKRVSLELGGKGANLVFADCDDDAIARGVRQCFRNSGQSCNAPTRMLVERPLYERAQTIAAKIAAQTAVASAHLQGEHLGPVVSKMQFDKIQQLIQSGIDDGAVLLAGGLGRPAGLRRGYYIRPTVFADVTEDMKIFNEEIFGPVLSMMPFDDEDEAVQLANNTKYGLTNYIQSQDKERCTRIALQLRSGMVQINGINAPVASFFGGVKYSGRAREGGSWGIEEFLDSKAISI